LELAAEQVAEQETNGSIAQNAEPFETTEKSGLYESLPDPSELEVNAEDDFEEFDPT